MVTVLAEQNAHRLKLTHPKLFTDICHNHAGRLLGITDRHRVAELIGNIQAPAVGLLAPHTPASSRKKLFKGLKASDQCHRVLGCPLDTGIVDRVVPVIKFLHSSDCLKTEGLFRIPGNCRHLRMLRETLNRGEDIARCLAVKPFSSHDVASLLKAFLSELPEPLLSEQHFSVHRLAAELLAEQHLQLVQILIHLLPAANVCLLKHLLGLLKRVCEQKETRLTAASLGRIFASHLLIPRGMLASDMLSVLPLAEKVVSVLISRSAVLFRLPDSVLRDMERQWARTQQPAASSYQSRRVERRCAMKRTRAKYVSETGAAKSNVAMTSHAPSPQSSAKQRLIIADNIKITENSRVIIVDMSKNSPSIHNGHVRTDESVSAACCPRTGHYSKSVQRHPNVLGTVQSSCRYAAVTSV